jgi:CoA binding protein
MISSHRAIDEFLAQPALALVGVSRSGKKFGNAALRELLAKGFRIYPLHPAMDVVGGVKCYHHFHEMPKDVGGVIVVVPPPEGVTGVAAARRGIAVPHRRVPRPRSRGDLGRMHPHVRQAKRDSQGASLGCWCTASITGLTTGFRFRYERSETCCDQL